MDDYYRQVFCQKIVDELADYKEEKLKLLPEELYHSAYEIDSFIRIFEIMIEESEKLSGEVLRKLICVPNLLNVLYGLWMDTEDSSEEELENCISRYIGRLNRLSLTEYVKRRWMKNEKVGIF